MGSLNSHQSRRQDILRQVANKWLQSNYSYWNRLLSADECGKDNWSEKIYGVKWRMDRRNGAYLFPFIER